LNRNSQKGNTLTQRAFTEPDIEGFEQAVDEFRDRVPELAAGLVGFQPEGLRALSPGQRPGF
jgi:hypothetical protein